MNQMAAQNGVPLLSFFALILRRSPNTRPSIGYPTPYKLESLALLDILLEYFNENSVHIIASLLAALNMVPLLDHYHYQVSHT